LSRGNAAGPAFSPQQRGEARTVEHAVAAMDVGSAARGERKPGSHVDLILQEDARRGVTVGEPGKVDGQEPVLLNCRSGDPGILLNVSADGRFAEEGFVVV